MTPKLASIFCIALSFPVAFGGRAAADSLLVGFNAQTALQVYSSSGAYQRDFGPGGASAGIEENGLLYAIQPNLTTLDSSTITPFNAVVQAGSSFTVPALIADGAPGANGTLWLSGYNGTVYQVNSGGSVVQSFDTGHHAGAAIGIATNGTDLFTTEGDASDGIDEWTLKGGLIATVHTGLYSLYGLTWDSANSEFYAGSFNDVYGFDLNFANGSAQLLSTISIPGDNRTPNGALHDGLEMFNASALKNPTPPPPPPPTVPEPGFGAFAGLAALLGLGLISKWRGKAGTLAACLAALGVIAAAPASASVSVKLNGGTSTIPVGETIAFTASASDTSNSSATFAYRFSVRPTGTVAFSVVKDFYKYNTFSWTPTAHEGSYDVQVIAQSSTGATGSTIETIAVTSRVQGGTPVVNATSHPLVALYSAPPCSSPKQVRVRFHAQGETAWQMTPNQTCDGSSLNFYIAGMRASTTYLLQQDLLNGPFDTPGPQLTFTTGSASASRVNVSPMVMHAAQPPTNTSYPFELRCTAVSFATDLQERIVWYLPANLQTGYMVRPLAGGTFLALADDQHGDHRFFREYDLAGNLVHETNWTVLNQELNSYRAAHNHSPANVHLTYFSHEGYRMPNGDTLTMVTEERVGNQGNGTVDILGDVIVVLDPNFQLKWAWDAFDWLNLTRKALQNNTCVPQQGGCPAFLVNLQPNGHPYTIANDWTHANSIARDPSDGNLIISLRHQAWVVKVNYANGSGDGHVIWKLGNQGDFTLANGLPASDWFNYQHDAEFQSNGLLALFDNNNLEAPADSRGQAWSLNQSTRVATLELNEDLGVQSYALGSAQLLSNGNYWFGAGFLNSGSDTQSEELTTSGAAVFRDYATKNAYRTFRLISMYRY